MKKGFQEKKKKKSAKNAIKYVGEIDRIRSRKREGILRMKGGYPLLMMIFVRVLI